MEYIVTIDSNDQICYNKFDYFAQIGDQAIQEYILEVYGQMNRVYHSLSLNEACGSDLENISNKM